jgi:hypothetical protein
MNNLAGREWADETIKLELKDAGIPISKFFGQHKHEVPWTYQGKLFGWTFTRAWYYWVVEGVLPLPVARYLYEQDKDKAIRVAGHCGSPPPEDPWLENYDANGYALYHTEKEPPKESIMHTIWTDVQLSGSYTDTPMAVAPYSYVTCYHIDSQAGLTLFANTIKKCEEISYKALADFGKT